MRVCFLYGVCLCVCVCACARMHAHFVPAFLGPSSVLMWDGL